MQQLSDAAQNLKPERRHLNADLLAGLTFAIVNVPQAMAHALLATVNPVLGIYTLMMAVPIGALFTSSVFMNVSTTSALSVAAGAGLADVASDQKAQALVAMVLLVGLIQLLAGLFKLGFLVRFVSDSVMTGFLNGVAVLIILGQLGDLTGYDSAYSNKVAQALDLLLHLDQINVQATVIGLLTLGLMGLDVHGLVRSGTLQLETTGRSLARLTKSAPGPSTQKCTGDRHGGVRPGERPLRQGTYVCPVD